MIVLNLSTNFKHHLHSNNNNSTYHKPQKQENKNVCALKSKKRKETKIQKQNNKSGSIELLKHRLECGPYNIYSVTTLSSTVRHMTTHSTTLSTIHHMTTHSTTFHQPFNIFQPSKTGSLHTTKTPKLTSATTQTSKIKESKRTSPTIESYGRVTP